VTSHAEATPQATCMATTKAGRPCRKRAVADGLCLFHSGKLDLAAIGRRGGQARGRKKPEQAGDRREQLANAAFEELLSSGSATAKAAMVKLALAGMSANSPEGLKAAKRALWAEQQAELKAELPFARAKLERLIESRAQTLAEQMHEE
jgi:hypothetical protein